jgi:hypothetical protein
VSRAQGSAGGRQSGQNSWSDICGRSSGSWEQRIGGSRQNTKRMRSTQRMRSRRSRRSRGSREQGSTGGRQSSQSRRGKIREKGDGSLDNGS